MYDILPVLGSERGRGRRWRWRFLDWVLATAMLNKSFELFGLDLSFSGIRRSGLVGRPCPLGISGHVRLRYHVRWEDT